MRVAALNGFGTIRTGFNGAGYATFTVGVDDASGAFSGSIANDEGVGNVTKIGGGTQVLSGTNTYTGGTTISGGMLQIGDGGTTGSLSTNSAILDNGTLAFNRSNTITQGTDFSGSAISGNGSLTQAGSGTLVLTATNGYTGTTTISSSGTLQLGNGGTTGSVAGPIVNNGALAFNRSDSPTFNNSISGTGSLRLPSGTVTLTGTNTYSGATNVNAGVLIVNGTHSGGWRLQRRQRRHTGWNRQYLRQRGGHHREHPPGRHPRRGQQHNDRQRRHTEPAEPVVEQRNRIL